MEVFMSWYAASHWEFFMMWNRMFGPMGWGVLAADPDQPGDSADDAMVAQAARECAVPVPAVVRDQHGDVV
jgi:hypothetical protein